MDLDAWSSCLRVLADPTRVRLLALLEREELTVAELSAVTRLAQPRVSTHLAADPTPAERDLLGSQVAPDHAWRAVSADTRPGGDVYQLTVRRADVGQQGLAQGHQPLKTRAIGQVFNVGNDEEVTIRELAERIGFLQIVGGQDDAGAFVAQLPQHRPEVAPRLDVQAGEHAGRAVLGQEAHDLRGAGEAGSPMTSTGHAACAATLRDTVP